MSNKPMRRKVSALLVAATALVALSGTAMARDNVSFSISFGVPGPVYAPATVYEAPAPVYYPAAPAYYPPGPVYYTPPRVVVVPPPPRVVYVPRFAQVPGVGHGHRHWREHRHPRWGY
jgi:hypothetical protein